MPNEVTIPGFSFKDVKRGGTRKYPWEEWLSQRRVVLTQGVDYHCSVATMCQMIRTNASRRAIPVRVVDSGNEIVVEVRGGEAIGTGGEFPIGGGGDGAPTQVAGCTLPQGAHV